ncbi:hypothetical protein EVA_01637 [gut metagenome]|uniref:Uncharacterized protein n=1 Tax=gut metagenome TaxID=749906 RepID=J9GPR6_9ZZZZ
MPSALGYVLFAKKTGITPYYIGAMPVKCIILSLGTMSDYLR